MLIKNISERKYIHNDIVLFVGSTQEVPDEISKIWLNTGDVVKVDDGSKDDEIARLKAENERLKAQVAEPTEISYGEYLRNEAKELKIKGYAKMSTKTLEKKIAEVKNK